MTTQSSCSPKPKLDIIIPAINHSFFTSSLINSIKKHTRIPYNIIYVDNGSGIGEFNRVLQTLEGTNHLVIRNSSNLGFVKAINQGLRLSSAEYICFQNNDTIIFENCLEQLIYHLEENSSTGIISPIASVGGGRQGVEIIKSISSWYELEIKNLDLERLSHQEISSYMYERFQNKLLEVKGTIAFYSVIMPRSTFDKVGYLDEKYELGLYEDDDYCHRVASEGLKLAIALDVYVWHLAGTTFKSIYPTIETADLLLPNKQIFAKQWAYKK